jgi:hypothetical protein
MLNEDFVDLLRALSAAEARFLVVGGYAVAIPGRPRATKDLDVWVQPTLENAGRVMRALVEFGAPLQDLVERDLATPGVWFQMGLAPNRVDVITEVPGLSFDSAWERRTEAIIDGLVVPVVGLEDLIANKRASGRPQDLADVAALERLARLRQDG